MEDSRNALFIEPNAYLKNFNNKTKCEVRPINKVVFSEPYDCMPNFYLDNNFQKGDGSVKKKEHNKPNCCNFDNKNCDCNNSSHNKQNFGFDIKSLMPILSGFNKGVSGFDLNSISTLLSNSGGGFDFSKLIANPQLISTVMSMFTSKKKLNNKKEENIIADAANIAKAFFALFLKLNIL